MVHSKIALGFNFRFGFRFGFGFGCSVENAVFVARDSRAEKLVGREHAREAELEIVRRDSGGPRLRCSVAGCGFSDDGFGHVGLRGVGFVGVPER